MALTLDEIEPAPVAETEATAPAPAPADTEGDIPDEVLDLPEFAGLLEGKPAAVSNEVGKADPLGAIIVKNIDALKDAGFGFYGSADKTLQVMFNTQFISGDEIKKADEDGKLQEVAVPLSELRSAYASVLGEGEAAPSATPAMPAISGPMAGPAPAGVQNRLGSARLRNLAVGSPTSGPSPGSGRLLNSLQKPVI